MTTKKPAAKKPVAKKPATATKKPVTKKVAPPPPPEVVEASSDDPRILYTIRLETSLVDKLHAIGENEGTTHAVVARRILRDALMKM